MIVISDSSVLMNLAAIKQLDLMPTIFGEVIISKGVFEEIVVNGWGKFGSQEFKDATWIAVKECTNSELLQQLLKVLDKGEAESIVLSKELNADLLIIDEKAGREIAQQLELQITGLLGVLLIAKKKGLIDSVKILMEQLQKEANFRISKSTFNIVLAKAREM
ncbi:MAG: DUF3368 domain-containing protein [Chitinophagales bacterium]